MVLLIESAVGQAKVLFEEGNSSNVHEDIVQILDDLAKLSIVLFQYCHIHRKLLVNTGESTSAEHSAITFDIHNIRIALEKASSHANIKTLLESSTLQLFSGYELKLNLNKNDFRTQKFDINSGAELVFQHPLYLLLATLFKEAAQGLKTNADMQEATLRACFSTMQKLLSVLESSYEAGKTLNRAIFGSYRTLFDGFTDYRHLKAMAATLSDKDKFQSALPSSVKAEDKTALTSGFEQLDCQPPKGLMQMFETSARTGQSVAAHAEICRQQQRQPHGQNHA
ncbi:MAG: hypothetical protein V4490_05610 [Pseudomonadota bacterium]